MDSVYENYYSPPTTASDGKCSLFTDTSLQIQEQEREVTAPKWTKVLLIVLAFALVFSLGGLGALWALYVNTLANVQSAQEKNSTIMRGAEEPKTNDIRADEQLSNCVASNLSVDGWTACSEKQYFFSSNKLNWWCSRDVCVSKGADLVTITSRSEQDFLVSQVNVTHWIGLSDLETEGRWVWVNNQTLSETGQQFWFRGGPTEPDNWRIQDPSGENCASLGDSNGNVQSWFDASCKKQKNFVCEKKI